ncbi:putative sugar O-methyltransferase, partial [Chitinimonas sp.]|uniref:putative sugar O-methyltransferase n=1 Tax=Chitinimonas sp. TaxID=1934313 RepID=UPI0035AE856E
MPLAPLQQQILTRMREENQRSGFPFAPGKFWEDELRYFNKAMQAFGINGVEDEYYNTRFSGVTPDDHRLFHWFMWTYYQLLQQRDVLNLLDTITVTMAEKPSYIPAVDGKPMSVSATVDINGKRYSPDMLFSIDDFYNLHELNPGIATEAVTVADLGSGWGRIGYLLLQINPKVSYIVLDLPEPLLISSTYLPKLLPDCSVADYLYGLDQPFLDRGRLLQKNLWFLGAQDIQKIAAGSIDYFINVASFQEMSLAQTNAYLGWAGKVSQGGHVYLRNGWEHTVPHTAQFSEYEIPAGWQRA